MIYHLRPGMMLVEGLRVNGPAGRLVLSAPNLGGLSRDLEVGHWPVDLGPPFVRDRNLATLSALMGARLSVPDSAEDVRLVVRLLREGT